MNCCEEIKEKKGCALDVCSDQQRKTNVAVPDSNSQLITADFYR